MTTFFNSVSAQEYTSIALSDKYPKAGQTIKVTYKLNNSIFVNLNDPILKVYWLDGSKYPVEKIKANMNSGDFSFVVHIPDSAKAFVIKVMGNGNIDDNNGDGYVFSVYNRDQPVKDAYAQRAYAIIQRGNEDNPHSAGLKEDYITAVEDYKKEENLYGELNKKELFFYYYSLTRLPGLAHEMVNDSSKLIIEDKIASFKNSKNEDDIILEAALLRDIRKPGAADSIEHDAVNLKTGNRFKKVAFSNDYFRDSSITRRQKIFDKYINTFSSDNYSDFSECN